MSAMETLSVPTLELVLERLGFSTFPAPGPRGLRAVYRAWCRKVPFDNVMKRIDLVEGYTPLRNTLPEDFFNLWLVHGIGGTCWPSSRALGALLHTLGFDARLGSAAMGDEIFGREHTHGTVIVALDDEQYWVDSSMLTDEPVLLVSGQPTELDHPLRPVRVEPVEAAWRVHWESGAQAGTLGCLLLDPNVDGDHYSTRYEWSRGMSRFNTALFATKNRDREVVTMGGGAFIRLDHDGRHSDGPLSPERRRELLIDEFGYSEAIVEALPPDDEPEN